METRKRMTGFVVGVSALAGLTVFSLLVVAGDLEPSAPPAPTMRTLDEVEPRIPLGRTIKPGDFACLYRITEGGSYYLARNITTPRTCIIVEANDVVIDLRGYQLSGMGGATFGNSCVYMNGCRNVEIRNGTIQDFGGYGVHEASPDGRGHRVIGIRVVSNAAGGISVHGDGHLVRDCTAAQNGTHGIIIHGDGSTVTQRRVI